MVQYTPLLYMVREEDSGQVSILHSFLHREAKSVNPHRCRTELGLWAPAFASAAVLGVLNLSKTQFLVYKRSGREPVSWGQRAGTMHYKLDARIDP